MAVKEQENDPAPVPLGDPHLDSSSGNSLEDFPTDEELKTLRHVPGRIPFEAMTIAFIELCERFSYYGTTVVCVSSRLLHYSL